MSPHDKDTIKEALKEVLDEHHKCMFSEEERGILRDVISVGRHIKSLFVWGITLFIFIGSMMIIYSYGISKHPMPAPQVGGK